MPSGPMSFSSGAGDAETSAPLLPARDPRPDKGPRKVKSRDTGRIWKSLFGRRAPSGVGSLPWAGVGALLCRAVLGALTIGIVVLSVAIGASVALATHREMTGGVAGIGSGLGFPFLYVAYLNRMGPGAVCMAAGGGGQQCTDEWSPWPWVAARTAVSWTGS